VLADIAGTSAEDRNFKGPFCTLGHVRYRLKRDTGVLERGLGSVGGVIASSQSYADSYVGVTTPA
jgi:hypothetical protein